ncbi:uncharacterized lipoprotein YehR (DUF1307 family) [Clostridium beijerinckii]|nr:hypothetical protein [Clostridium beijerinckii]MBA2912301.1 uncharacterized lipoprotein YehR (DUF1307 family) [Clostridium beijerinckii]MBC2433376.1 hypothetical protein [Clostridium beijerinckii]MBC2490576.1 hypothetical protein [Clostridium beijerinckii]MBC2539759.1 hypothetical protein [Clostridium beijerinckii]NRT01940.1 uncharacterized lipoprotein YehR (DUF1307 family) [Clostridium beijerinckii]
MKKKFIASVLALFTITSLVGCGSTQTTENADAKEPTRQESNKNANPLDGLKQEFVKAGFTVGDNKELAYSMLGATNGYKFDLNGSPIEIYYYDSKNLKEDDKKFYEQAKKGKIDMSGINVPVVLKNDIMIVRADEHKDKDKILEVFNNFKY